MPRPLLATPEPLMGPALADRYAEVRGLTEALRAPLSVEDCVVQSMPDASPVKWHLAHTTWFFETFLLRPYLTKYETFDREFAYLFNSYYDTFGARQPRAERGLLTRPALHEVEAYRDHVDRHMAELIGAVAGAGGSVETARLVEVGLHHEQQHQELMLTDLKHLLSRHPSRPAYVEPDGVDAVGSISPREVVDDAFLYEGGLVEVGHAGGAFAYDNESPRHRVWLEPFRIAARPVANAEFLAFVEDGGYRRPNLWLSDGWAAVTAEGWAGPAYWDLDEKTEFTLGGTTPLDPGGPVCHVSQFEADAFARWAGARLPTESEWEHACLGGADDDPTEADLPAANLLGEAVPHPVPPPADSARPAAMLGDVWEWTASAYLGYPGYRPPAGALGEYNGKFMSGQIVLRGGSCATPRSHVRPTYRNFFPPSARWQFGGFRLAWDG